MTTNNFILTTLSQNPEYFDEVIQLIEEEFHYTNNEHSFEKDFAPLINPLNFENCFIYIDKEKNIVAAHLAVCIRTLIKDQIETPIALIGGIVTHKNYRKKNLFKNLMQNAVEIYIDKVSLYLLWSDLAGIYEKFDFYLAGGIIESGKRILSANDRPSGYEKTHFPLLSEKDFENISELYKNFNEKKFLTIKREEKDWSLIREMKSIDLYIKRNLEGNIVRYFCINKGRDLANIIHEVSCLGPEDFNNLVKELEGFQTWLPETEADKVTNKEFFYTAFIKLGNVDLLNSFLNGVSHNQLSVMTITENSVDFKFNNQDHRTSAKDFLQFLLGPKPLEEFEKFKLSLYISGADSV